MSDLGTHAFVGSLPCGCGVHFTSDMPNTLDAGGHVVSLLRAGYVVRWLPRAAAMTLMNTHCPRYPHEPWQIAYEARLQRFREHA